MLLVVAAAAAGVFELLLAEMLVVVLVLVMAEWVADDMLLLDDDWSGAMAVACLVWVDDVGLWRGVVLVLYVVWYLERPRRGSDFCSDMGDRSDEVLDWLPW